MESLGRLREPAAYVVFGTLCLELVASVLSLVLLSRDGGYGSTADVALSVGARFPHALTIVVLALLVASCLLVQPTRHAGTLALVAIIGGGIAVLQQLVFALIGLAASGTGKSIGLVATLLSLVIPSIALGGLGVLLRMQGRVKQPSASPSLTSAATAQRPAAEKPAAIAGPTYPPTWQSEAATGVAWQTAGEAAAGAPGAGWGSNESGGWQPIPGRTDIGQSSAPDQQSLPPGRQPPAAPPDPWQLDWTTRPGDKESDSR